MKTAEDKLRRAKYLAAKKVLNSTVYADIRTTYKEGTKRRRGGSNIPMEDCLVLRISQRRMY